jgi:hypothetical protein
MKSVSLSVVLILLCSCAVLQSPRLPDLTGGEFIDEDFRRQTQQNCERNFVSGNWQFVHSITFKMANGHGATVIGVTVLDGDTMKTGLMTVEGFVLFEAELDKGEKLHVNRALPPFDNSEFALGLMRDVHAIFLIPSEGNPVVTRLADGDSVCRYEAADGQIIDVIPTADGSNVMNVYDADQTRIRSITTNDFVSIDTEMIPENIHLTALGLRGYTLKMTLISADKIKNKRI